MDEHIFSIDSFKEPKILNGDEAIETLITRLFLLEKGTIKSHPDMGIGLLSHYRYYDADKLEDLRTETYNQLIKYIPRLSVLDIEITYNDSEKGLDIKISIDNNIFYIFSADFESNKVKLIDIINL